MVTEPGVFETFYASAAQHPLLLWLAAGLAFAWCRTRRGVDAGVARACTLLTALSITDAWLTASHVWGIGRLPGALASAVPLVFVLAGDFRWLLLLESATPDGRIEPHNRGVLRAAGLTLVVPLLSQALVAALPERAGGGGRVLFLVYELGFLLLAAALLHWHPGARRAPWLAPVGGCVLLYYGLWAAADAILLATGSDLGFLLRVAPNLLYYGGFVAVLGSAASRAAPPPPAPGSRTR